MSGAAQPNNKLTLVDLLDEGQPYRRFNPRDEPKVKLSSHDEERIRRIQGSLVGLAIGDAVGAPVEFRPNAYLKENRVTEMLSGGTWGLKKGQWTDDTSMALCLAASLIVKGEFDAYDQFVRYRRWYREGYMSSTGNCFDIGKSTRDAITMFEDVWQKARTKINSEKKKLSDSERDALVEREMLKSKKGLKFGTSDAAGNGPLMRLAPIPCFFSDSDQNLMKYIDEATTLTHGDKKAIDACKFYAGLIWHALQGMPKKKLLSETFYHDTLQLKLHSEVQEVAEGSYKKKKNGYEDGIRGKGYVVNSLEAALWAFDNDEDNFEKGVILAVNLGDDTDTTAAIYGELAGAVYGIDKIRPDWIADLYQGEFIKAVANGLYIRGEKSRQNAQRSYGDKEPVRSTRGAEASGTSNTRYDQDSPVAKNASNSSQATGTDGTPDQIHQEKTGDASDSGHKSSMNTSSSSKDGPHVLE